MDQAHELREWYNSEGKDVTVQKIANTGGGGGGPRVDQRIMMHEIKDRNLGMAVSNRYNNTLPPIHCLFRFWWFG